MYFNTIVVNAKGEFQHFQYYFPHYGYSSPGSQRASVIADLPRNPLWDAADLVTETRNLSHTRRGLRGKPAMTRVFLRGCEK